MVLRNPFEHAVSVTDMKARFLKSGIYLLGPDAVERAKMLPWII